MVREHRIFLSAFGIFLFVGIYAMRYVPHGDEVLFFGAYRSTFWDVLFKTTTLLGEGYPFVLAGAVLWRIRRKYPWDITLLGFCISIVSYLTKTLFAQERPVAFLKNAGKLDLLVPVEGVVVHGGNTSFPSGHTMAAFGLYTFLALLMRGRGLLSLFWLFIAIMVGISRIYLAQHFLRDVLAGAFIGAVIAFSFASFQRKASPTSILKP